MERAELIQLKGKGKSAYKLGIIGSYYELVCGGPVKSLTHMVKWLQTTLP